MKEMGLHLTFILDVVRNYNVPSTENRYPGPGYHLGIGGAGLILRTLPKTNNTGGFIAGCMAGK